MFYETNLNNHGLKYNPFKSCIVPRPIAWISTLSKNATINIAPYSYFNAVSDIPPVIMFSSSKKLDGDDKDSIRNIKNNQEFVVNICSYEDRFKLSNSSAPLPYGESEADAFEIGVEKSHMIDTPRIKSAKIALECMFIKKESLIVNEKAISADIVFGHVVGIYIDDAIIEDGKVSIAKLGAISRLGYDEYALIDNIFSMPRA